MTALRRGILMMVCLWTPYTSGPVRADVPELPRVTRVPPTAAAPLSSAERPGTEYADLAAAGYIEEEFYLHGVAPAITAAEISKPEKDPKIASDPDWASPQPGKPPRCRIP